MPFGVISMMRVATEDTNSRSWLTKIRVPAYFSNANFNDSIDYMSMWLVGSSITKILGR
jgi:hypothetical protein